MIPAEAVEAAAKALFDDVALNDKSANWTNYQHEFRRQAILALEAAAPCMRRVVPSVEELYTLPGGAVIIGGDETVLEKSYIEPRWWQAMGTHDATSIDDIKLPATVLHRPTP